MECTSCNVDIDPKWRHAIEQNICPFCGQGIMDEHLKNLLISLRQTMDKLDVDYNDQLNDFMLSNFGFIRVDSPDLINYVDPSQLKSAKSHSPHKESSGKRIVKIKVKNENGEIEEVETETETLMSDEETSKFLDRAKEGLGTDSNGVPFNSIAEKNKRIKAMVNGIKNKSADAKDASMADINIASLLSEDEQFSGNASVTALYPEDVESNDPYDDPYSAQDDLDYIPSSVLNMAKKASTSASKQQKDMETLKRLQNAANNKTKTFASGRDSSD